MRIFQLPTTRIMCSRNPVRTAPNVCPVLWVARARPGSEIWAAPGMMHCGEFKFNLEAARTNRTLAMLGSLFGALQIRSTVTPAALKLARWSVFSSDRSESERERPAPAVGFQP